MKHEPYQHAVNTSTTTHTKDAELNKETIKQMRHGTNTHTNKHRNEQETNEQRSHRRNKQDSTQHISKQVMNQIEKNESTTKQTKKQRRKQIHIYTNRKANELTTNAQISNETNTYTAT